MAKYNRWCFTVNNYTLEPVLDPSMDYLVYGIERGENGTPHLQGYVRFKLRKTLAAVKRILDERGHYERAKGDEKTNREYCTKDGNFKEFGTFDEKAGKQGHRSDLEDLTTEILSGMTSLQHVSFSAQSSETNVAPRTEYYDGDSAQIPDAVREIPQRSEGTPILDTPPSSNDAPDRCNALVGPYWHWQIPPRTDIIPDSLYYSSGSWSL